MPDTMRHIGRSPACCVSVRTSHINRGVSAFFTFRLSREYYGSDFTDARINHGMVGAEESQLLGDITTGHPSQRQDCHLALWATTMASCLCIPAQSG